MLPLKTLLLYPRFNEQVPYRVPLGICYIGAYLKKEGLPVLLRDGAFYKNLEEFKEDLLKNKPEVLGVSLSSFIVKNGMMYIEYAKKIKPDIKIVVGGPHCCVYPKEILKNKSIDFVIYGEGELTFVDLVNALSFNGDVSKILGLGYKKNNQIIINEPRPLLDLDSRPLPYREGLPIKEYLSQRPTMPLPYPATDIEASRGCFGNCLYCQPVLRKMFGAKVRSRSVTNVVDEIEYLIKKYKIKGINLGNDEPIVFKKWTRDFCNEIIRRKIKIKIISPSRVDTLDLETMKLMQKAGFIHLSFGVESLTQEILDTFRKGTKISQIKNAFRLCEEAGISGRANLMIGSPGESHDSVRRVIEFIKKDKPDFIYISATTPTPGSDLFEYAKEKGLLVTSDFKKYQSFNVGYLKLKNFTSEDIYYSIQKVATTYKIGLLKYLLNPVTFMKKRYLFRIIFYHYWTLLIGNPKEMLKDLFYLTRYGKHIKKIKITKD